MIHPTKITHTHTAIQHMYMYFGKDVRKFLCTPWMKNNPSHSFVRVPEVWYLKNVRKNPRLRQCNKSVYIKMRLGWVNLCCRPARTHTYAAPNAVSVCFEQKGVHTCCLPMFAEPWVRLDATQNICRLYFSLLFTHTKAFRQSVCVSVPEESERERELWVSVCVCDGSNNKIHSIRVISKIAA